MYQLMPDKIVISDSGSPPGNTREKERSFQADPERKETIDAFCYKRDYKKDS
jgi:hypothetical protein